MKRIIIVVLVFFAGIISSEAQSKKQSRKGEFYFSWGYNKEWYTHSNVKINQPSLNNHYTLRNVISHDRPGWDEGIFSIPISIPPIQLPHWLFLQQKERPGI